MTSGKPPFARADRDAPRYRTTFQPPQNRCPTDLTPARRYRWSVAAGAGTQIFDRAREPGRPSEHPAWAWVQVPQPLR